MSPVTHDTAKPVLEVSGLTVFLGGLKALDDVSFTLSRGDSVAVVGPNGAGKSTLFRAVSGVLPYQSGRVTVFGSDPGGHVCIAYVPQSASVDWKFPVTVFDAVMMGRTARIGLFRRPSRSDKSLVYQCLEMVNMEDLAGRQIGMLSGGQRQRVFIARALAQQAEIILLDEPLTGLDISSQKDIFIILRSLVARGVTILVSTHDLDTAADWFSLVMLLNRRLVGFGSKEDVLTPETLLGTFGGHVSVQEGNGKKRVLVYDSCCEGGGADRAAR
jgi:manganese/iron transport system ATP-binding protein